MVRRTGVFFICFFAVLQLMALDGLVVFTRSRNVQDLFRETVFARPRVFNAVREIPAGETFRIAFFCRECEKKEGFCRMNLTIRLAGPDGKTNEWKHVGFQVRVPENAGQNLIFLGEDQLKFEKKDRPGLYHLSAELTDIVSGKKVRLTRDVTLRSAGSSPKESREAVRRKLGRYYVVQDPSLILPALEDFLNVQLPRRAVSAGKKFSPLPVLAFFYFALQEHPQLYPELGKLAGRSEGDTVKYLTFLASELGDGAWKHLPPALRKQKKAAVRNPFRIEKAVLPIHVEILWSEFLCTGRRSPVLRMTEAVSGMRDGMTPETFRLLKKPAAQDKALLVRYLTGRRAVLLLRNQAKQHPVLFAYLEKMLVTGEIRDNFTKVMLDQLLQDAAQDLAQRKAHEQKLKQKKEKP